VASAPNGNVLVWEAGRTRILLLSQDLQLIGTAGREGQGPGEFVYQRVPHGHWIAAGDSSFVVVGLGTGIFSEFALDGRFIRNPSRSPPPPIGILRVAVRGRAPVYAVDEVNRQNGDRVLQTWRLEQHPPHSLVRSDRMPSLPTWAGRPVSNLPLQADPSWSMGAACAFISDGSGDWVLASHLESGVTDTLRLPPIALVEPTDQDLDQWSRMWAESRRFGLAPSGIEQLRPTARAKWSRTLVDPDGFLWVEPWRPPSYADSLVDAVVVDPRTGEARSIRLPRFPDAFLPDGGFVAVTSDGGSPVVEKYVAG
jgi:hypothetical protein